MISYGHPPCAVWDYTPAQATAFVGLAEKRRRRMRALDLSATAMAHRAKADDINRKIKKDWGDDE